MTDSPLRIALVAPLISPISDPFLGGSQAIVHDLATGLARRGHAVTVFAADGSIVPGAEVVRLGIDPARLKATDFFDPRPSVKAIQEEERACFLRIAYEIRRRVKDFDVVHNHAFDAPPFELFQDAHPHVCHTLHLPPVVPDVVRAARDAATRGATLVTVSCWAERAWNAHLGRVRTVRNGVPVERIAIGPMPRDGWIYVGRIAPEKGLEDALIASEGAGRRLRVVGPVYDDAYARALQPRLGQHEILGALSRDDVFAQLGRAEGLLMPVAWDEPFGLVAAEAMAAGTPVAAYDRGALPEMIAQGETGYLVPAGDVEALGRAAGTFGSIDPSRCRQQVVRHFGLPRMLSDYEALYREIG